MTNLAMLDALDGLITADIGRSLYNLARHVPGDQVIVELGSYHGKSTAYLAAGARDGNGSRVYAVDAWSKGVNAWSRYHATPSFERWQQQLTSVGLRRQVTPLRGLTVHRGRTYSGPPVGLLYVDADHAEEAVHLDVAAWRTHLVPGALVVFDDYDTGRRNPGVLAAAHALIADGTLTDLTKQAERLAVCRLA